MRRSLVANVRSEWGLALVVIPLAFAVLASGCGGGRSGSPTTTARPPSTTPHAQRPTTPSRPHPKPHRRAPRQQVRQVLFGQILQRLPTRHRVVALTFDAGANAAGAAKIIAALQAGQVRATFFITGRWANLYPHWARRIAAHYPVGNHTFDHRDLRTLKPAEVEQEILIARRAIARITRQPPAPLFRFPYGSSTPSALRIANELGYNAVGWTVDTLGWEGTSNGQTTRSVVAHALSHLQPGEIILMHVGSNPTDGSTLDANALPTIIRAIRRRGYTFVALPGSL
jgi:peptidoglycan/xylan/chitin deacetylase (PgdA/CDA1 family)